MIALLALFAVSSLPAHVALADPQTPRPLAPAAGLDALVERVWAGVLDAQGHSTICGSLTETRTSRLLVRPLVLRATFCVAGTTGFRVDYTEPEAMSIVFDKDYLNVITDRGRRTEAFEAGSGVSRAMGYFSGSESLDNLRRDFAVTAEDTGATLVLRLEPVAGRFRSRTGLIVAAFDARGFRITRLEINGRNGVRSVFDIRIDKVDVPLDASMFRVHRPAPTKEPRP